MKKLTLPVVLALALGAGATGALAQSTTTGQQGSSSKTMTQDQMGSSTTQLHAMSQSKLSQALKQAGFTDVQVPLRFTKWRLQKGASYCTLCQ